MALRSPESPLYDPSHEHDACGIGFVADAGGRSRGRVLPLAVAGLAALGHRGAFGSDGESSDGAGMSLPLEAGVLEQIGAGAIASSSGRPGVVQLFLPRGRVRNQRGRDIVAAALAAEGLSIAAWRTVPADRSALGRSAAESAPAFAQAIVARPSDLGAGPGTRRNTSTAESAADSEFERRLILARRRAETAARAAGLDDFAIPSASARTIVYKGLVTGGRLARLFPDLAANLDVSYALFHQRYATNTHPVWRLAQPFRWLGHNGEINTVRGNREQVRGRAADPDENGRMREALDAGPLLSPDGSDSLSLDEAMDLLVMSGWDLSMALLAAIPEAPALRRVPHPLVGALRRRTAGFLAPWDGPAAIVFADGKRVGALVDRNGLRPAAYATTRDGLVAVASEAGAVPISPAETVTRGRLGPGELLLVDPGRKKIFEDAEAKSVLLRRLRVHAAPRPTHVDRAPTKHLDHAALTSAPIRYLAGLDAERMRLDIKTMTLESHEPLWSMGDDTPTPGRARIDRRAVDHLRQAFAQVTNPPIDPERERIVMDLRVELGRRPALLGGLPRTPVTVRLERPVIADLDGLMALAGRRGRARIRRIDTTWDAAAGPGGLEAALDRIAAEATTLARGDVEVLLLSDRAISTERLPIASALAVGAIHRALTDAGLRGRTDLVVEAADVLDVHSCAMAIAAGATAVHPWLAIECASELAGTRGAEELSVEDAVEQLVAAFLAGLRKTLARMGISAISSYVGGGLFETLELAPEVVARCFPAAMSWPGTVGFADLADRQLRRAEAAQALPEPAPGREARLPDPGFSRFKGDGEFHLYAPKIVDEVQELASVNGVGPKGLELALRRYREGLARLDPAVVRDGFTVRRATRRTPLDDVEPASAIVRRFVVSAMSVGALSPEAHQTLTIGIQRAGGAANTGEGGEDPAWYAPRADGERHDARIKQVASARFGVTAQYLARAEQLEIKIAQGSKPGEGGQLPARKATAYIAALRRGQPGMSYISPPPHHDIYSIEDLAQLIADLRAINPVARIGVKLVASRGVGTVAAGVVKAGADYVHLSGHSGGTGASPLSSIKHVAVPWELGLAEVHQVLLRNDLRDRTALRTDGGLQTGRDLLIAALLGAEEFAFGTAALVAIGCDMARQCHLDTCPTGIATQREDLRAKFTGTPEMVERFARNLAEDFRRELAAIGARSVGEIVGESAARLRVVQGGTIDLGPIVAAPRWGASPARRSDPAGAGRVVHRPPASPLEARLVAALHGQSSVKAGGLRLTTADRSFGAALSGALERGEVRAPVRLELHGSAGQSFGAFLAPDIDLRLVGQANDYVGKGLSGGTVALVPEPDLGADGDGAPPLSTGTSRTSTPSLAGNTCLYGATGGRLHVAGRAGMRFGVRNAGADAVVEGIGPHGAEYMTGGTIVVLGSVGANFGAGMTGGRAYLHDPEGDRVGAIHPDFLGARRLAEVAADPERADAAARVDDLLRLVEAHCAAGSKLAGRLLEDPARLIAETWLVEPLEVAAPVEAASDAPAPAPAEAAARAEAGAPSEGARFGASRR
ncbi:MAG TPA: glutamate synthase large subunit [Candidatus Limnocylindrales bacterium]